MVSASRTDIAPERREQILNAAVTVFARTGFQTARMEDVAREAGLSKGTLYLYFDSKDAIIGDLMQRLFDHELCAVREILEAPGDVPDCLLALTRRVARDVERMAALLPLTWEFYAIAARQESARAYFREYFRSYRGALSAFLHQRMERRELQPADPEALAITIAALFEGLALLWFTDPDAVRWEQQTTAAMRLLLAGLARPRAKKE
jgi:AcrR family transcriptional regulator